MVSTIDRRHLFLGLTVFGLLTGCSNARSESSPVAPAPPRIAKAPAGLQYPIPPSSLPLAGPDGVDEHGYPKRYVDKIQIQALARAGLFPALDRFAHEARTLAEQDFHNEYWPIQVLEAFDTADPAITTVVDGWVAAFPASCMALAASGIHHNAIGWARRGAAYSKETSAGQFKGMEDSHRGAVAKLERALALCPKLTAAHRGILSMGQAGGAPQATQRARLDAAVAACPSCFAPKEMYLWGLFPEWAVPLAELEKAASELARDTAQNPRLALLAGFADDARCEGVWRKTQPPAALSACDAAVARAPGYWHFRLARAKALSALGRSADSIQDLDVALRDKPQSASVLRQRAFYLVDTDRLQELGHNVWTLQRLDPTSRDVATLVPPTVKKLVYAAYQAHSAGDPAMAVALYDSAIALDPSDADAKQRRARAVQGRDAQGKLASLEGAVAKQPEDLDARHALAIALVTMGKYPDAAQMWDDFIASHSQSGRAYFERGAVYFQWGDKTKSLADAQRACDLGYAEGCKIRDRLQQPAASK